jgi:hypothetical protein
MIPTTATHRKKNACPHNNGIPKAVAVFVQKAFGMAHLEVSTALSMGQVKEVLHPVGSSDCLMPFVHLCVVGSL